MDSESDKLGRAGAIGLAIGVVGFISLLVVISMLGPFIPKIIRNSLINNIKNLENKNSRTKKD